MPGPWSTTRLLLLADESTGTLDTATSAEIMALLPEFNSDGQTIVMVTHNAENQAYFDRVLVLRDGLPVSDEHIVDPSQEISLEVG